MDESILSLHAITPNLDYSAAICTYIPGGEVDRMLSAVLLEQVTPLAMEAALSVQQAPQRAHEAEKLLHRQVERACSMKPIWPNVA